jgi:hypothetical protein
MWVQPHPHELGETKNDSCLLQDQTDQFLRPQYQPREELAAHPTNRGPLLTLQQPAKHNNKTSIQNWPIDAFSAQNYTFYKTFFLSVMNQLIALNGVQTHHSGLSIIAIKG